MKWVLAPKLNRGGGLAGGGDWLVEALVLRPYQCSTPPDAPRNSGGLSRSRPRLRLRSRPRLAETDLDWIELLECCLSASGTQVLLALVGVILQRDKAMLRLHVRARHKTVARAIWLSSICSHFPAFPATETRVPHQPPPTRRDHTATCSKGRIAGGDRGGNNKCHQP